MSVVAVRKRIIKADYCRPSFCKGQANIMEVKK